MSAELRIDADSVYFNYSLNRGDTGFLAPGVIRFVLIDPPGLPLPGEKRAGCSPPQPGVPAAQGAGEPTRPLLTLPFSIFSIFSTFSIFSQFPSTPRRA